MPPQQFDLFMSHKKQDKPLVEQIGARLLDEYSIRTWLDQWDLRAGREWEDEIEWALESCTACAVFLSGNGWGAYHLKEARAALERAQRHPEFTVIPVLLPGAREQDMQALPDLFHKMHRVDFSTGINDESAFRALMSAVRGESQGPPTMTAFTIRRDAQRWEQAPGQDKSLLYRGFELREAQKIATQAAGQLNEAAVSFLAASATEETRHAHSERRRNRIIIAVLSLLLVAFAASTVYAFRKRAEAERQTNLANQQTRAAEEQREEALKQTRIATEQSRLAEERRRAEEEQRNIAEKQTGIAEERRQEAEQQRVVADKQRQIALEQKRNADAQREIAVRQQRLAEERRQEAETATAHWKEAAEVDRRLSYVGSMAQAQEAVQLGDENWLTELLEGQRPQPGQEDLRGFEWFYQSSQLRNQHQRLALGSEERNNVRVITFSPDSRRMVSWQPFVSRLTLWEVETGRKIATLDGLPQSLQPATFSPDSRLLATIGSGQVKLWDTRTGSEERALRLDGQAILSVAFAPDSQRLAAGCGDKRVRVWDVSTGQEVMSLTAGRSEIFAVTFSADGGKLAAADGFGKLFLWDAATGQLLKSYQDPGGAVVWSLVFSPDDRMLITFNIRNIAILSDAMTLEPIERMSDALGFAVFSPDSKTVVIGSRDKNAAGDIDRTVRLYDIAERKFRVLKGHASSIRCVAFSPDGQRLVSGGGDGVIKLWDMRTFQAVLSIKAHEGNVDAVAFSPDGLKLASGGEDKTLNLWQLETANAQASP